MREIEDRFLALGLPYRVIGGPRFYERREIRDAIAYFRLAVSQNDDLAFERIVNTPKRGVGEKAQALIQIEARKSELSMVAATVKLLRENAFQSRAASSLRRLMTDLSNWTELVRQDQMPLSDLAGQILDESGLPEMWKNQKTPESVGRLENLKELVKGMEEFDNLQGFLEHVALVYENLEDTESSKVSLMTLHGSKGLEFPVVFLPGWEEDIFPSRRAVEDQQRGIEEERRLAYVGLTRAQDLSYVSFASTRFYYGENSAQHPSRFVEELPAPHVEVLTPPGLYGSFQPRGQYADFGGTQLSLRPDSGGYASPGFRRMTRRASDRTDPPAAVRLNSSAAPARFRAGERVFNTKFGYGEVIDVSDDKLKIEFDQAGSKNIISRHVQKADGTEG